MIAKIRNFKFLTFDGKIINLRTPSKKLSTQTKLDNLLNKQSNQNDLKPTIIPEDDEFDYLYPSLEEVELALLWPSNIFKTDTHQIYAHNPLNQAWFRNYYNYAGDNYTKYDDTFFKLGDKYYRNNSDGTLTEVTRTPEGYFSWTLPDGKTVVSDKQYTAPDPTWWDKLKKGLVNATIGASVAEAPAVLTANGWYLDSNGDWKQNPDTPGARQLQLALFGIGATGLTLYGGAALGALAAPTIAPEITMGLLPWMQLAIGHAAGSMALGMSADEISRIATGKSIGQNFRSGVSSLGPAGLMYADIIPEWTWDFLNPFYAIDPTSVYNGVGNFTRNVFNWGARNFYPIRNWAAGYGMRRMPYAEPAPQVTSQGKYLKTWKDGNGANVSERFGIEGHPEKGYFEVVHDNEPGYHSVHFKTSPPGEANALTTAEKEALFNNLAELIPEGDYVSTWAPEGSSGITKGGRAGLDRFGELGFELVGTRPALFRETGEMGEIPIWLKTAKLYLQELADKVLPIPKFSWTDAIPTNNVREADGVIRTQLPGFRGYKFEFDKNTGKFNLTIDNIGLDNLSKNGLVSLTYPTQLTEELATKFLNNEFELFNETAHPFQKVVYKYYDNLPKVEVNEMGQWSNYKDLIDKTPAELRTILENRWNYLNNNLHRTPEYSERVIDAVTEYNKTAPIKLDANAVLSRILNDAAESTTPIVYRHVISNGGVSFPTTLHRPWGVNATTVSSTIDETIIHEMEHLLYGSSMNDIAKINNTILNSEGGLTANRTEAFAKLSPERLKYLGNRDEFFAHIKEGVDAIIRLGKSIEQVMQMPSIKELATVYKSDFVKKMLLKVLVASGMIAGGEKVMNNDTNNN